jgi:predicted nucleic acid-binding protein
VTTDEVLGEYLNFFSRAPQHLRRQVAASIQAILHDPTVRVIPQSRETFLSGVELFTARPDKGYSLTDCVSMQTMRREGLTDVLTNDWHFEQEGFRALFRES